LISKAPINTLLENIHIMTKLTFLDLPGEIRNQIYRLLLIIPDISTPRPLGDPRLYPRILRVCHKVNEEAKQILYGSNVFLAHPNLLTGLPRLRLYYDTIRSVPLIALIRRFHIRVRLDCDPNFSAAAAKDAFSGVEELTMEVFQAQFGSSDYRVLELFQDVRGVHKVRIYGSVTAFPEYANWLRDAMRSPKGSAVKAFQKAPEQEVGSYDIWTVSGNAAGSIN
jgi:hypothetical protein